MLRLSIALVGSMLLFAQVSSAAPACSDADIAMAQAVYSQVKSSSSVGTATQEEVDQAQMALLGFQLCGAKISLAEYCSAAEAVVKEAIALNTKRQQAGVATVLDLRLSLDQLLKIRMTCRH